MEKKQTGKERIAGYIYYVARIGVLLSIVMMFFPGLNPAKICDYINKTMSLFTSGISYGSLTEQCVRAFNQGWLQESSFIILFISSMIAWIGIVVTAVMGCMSIGNLKMKRLGNWFGIGGALAQMIGLAGIYLAYTQVAATTRPEKVIPNFPLQNWLFFFIIAAVVLVTTLVIQILLPKPEADAKYEMESRFKLFLMFLPFAALCFVFSYLPLYGWRYAFYDYQAGGTLSKDNFVGFQWFTMLFQNEATRSDIVRVLRNTLVMSGLGIATSWLPMAFAIFLSEMKSARMKRFVQTFATIPNFISWVLVYSIAYSVFSSTGVVNSIGMKLGLWDTPQMFLQSADHIWFKMWLWLTWKNAGWAAIMYLAAIAGIDESLKEAAKVDGASRMQIIWHITIPSILPTYFVLVMLNLANFLSNGMEQYFVFQNAFNKDAIQVLDLYVYNLAMGSGGYSLSTAISILKSVVSLVLLCCTNKISKLVRGEGFI